MRNNILKKLFAVYLPVMLIFGACNEDIQKEITSIDFNRVFTPTSLKADIYDDIIVKAKWDIMGNADAYAVEISLDSCEYATIVKTDTVKPDNVPYSVILEAETQYTLRVKGINYEGADESHWAVLVFATNSEQILGDVTNISDSSATMNWPAGYNATHFIINPGAIQRDITPGEVAAGQATLYDLIADENYTVSIYNNEKLRGTAAFKTLIDLSGFVLVYDGTDLDSLLDAADDNLSFLLYPGTYEIGDYALTKNIKLRGQSDEDKPVIIGRFTFGVDLTSVTFANIELNGVDASTYSNPFELSADANIGSITLEGCLIHKYKKHIFYDGKNNGLLGEFSLNNCVVDSITGDGGDGFDFRSSCVKKLTYTNTTFSNCFRTFIRMDYEGDQVQEVTIDHCTFYRVCSFDNSNNSGLLRVSGTGADHSVAFSNSVLYDIGGDTDFGVMSKGKISSTTTVTLNHNDYFESPDLWTKDPFIDNADDFDSDALELDPEFSDAKNNDFTIGNAELIHEEVGDPQWY
jgi:hypothetical protein